jgi:hypothetical protein
VLKLTQKAGSRNACARQPARLAVLAAGRSVYFAACPPLTTFVDAYLSAASARSTSNDHDMSGVSAPMAPSPRGVSPNTEIGLGLRAHECVCIAHYACCDEPVRSVAHVSVGPCPPRWTSTAHTVARPCPHLSTRRSLRASVRPFFCRACAATASFNARIERCTQCGTPGSHWKFNIADERICPPCAARDVEPAMPPAPAPPAASIPLTLYVLPYAVAHQGSTLLAHAGQTGTSRCASLATRLGIRLGTSPSLPAYRAARAVRAESSGVVRAHAVHVEITTTFVSLQARACHAR